MTKACVDDFFMDELIIVMEEVTDEFFLEDYSEWLKIFYLASTTINVNTDKNNRISVEDLIPDVFKRRLRDIEDKHKPKLSEDEKLALKDRILNEQ